MIERITVRADYCFGTDPLVIDSLGKVNFLFAPNGAGKSTISAALAAQPDDAEARRSWPVAPTELAIKVFNEAYRAKVLRQDIAGIFTLGEDSRQVNDQIDALNASLASMRDERYELLKEIGSVDGKTRTGLRGELANERERAAEALFEQHKRVPDPAREIVFTGVRNNKERFLDRAVANFERGDESVVPENWGELNARASVITGDLQQKALLPGVQGDVLAPADKRILENAAEIKGDGKLSELIESLHNADWVSSGREYLAAADGKCPFCQQTAPADLAKELSQFFAGGFDQALKEVSSVATAVGNKLDVLDSQLSALERSSHVYGPSNENSIRASIEKTRTATALLRAQVGLKLEHPTSPVEVADVNGATAELVALVRDGNAEVASHNQLVADAKAERSRLISDGWNLFLSQEPELSALKRWRGQQKRKNGQIADLESKVRGCDERIEASLRRVTELQQSVSNTAAVAGRINELLVALDFDRFRLQVADGKAGGYRLCRSDGTVAVGTLSEGEKSFVCFAYFWESLRGTNDPGGVPEQCVAVIDDPISSLDSDCLFLVASLVREAAKEAASGASNVRQLLVLTHNVQFHLEAAFTTDRSQKGERCYFRLVKGPGSVSNLVSDGGVSRVKGSYSLLWDAVVAAANDKDQDSIVHVGLFNVVRRIIEGYFRLVGQPRVSEFPTSSISERRILTAFEIWASAGSHTILDEVSQTSDVGSTKRFLSLFCGYFVAAGQVQHFRSMVMQSGGSELLEAGSVFEGAGPPAA